MDPTLRPDEKAAIAARQRGEKAHNILSSVATGVTGIGAATQILPFLNKLVPVDLALKGINKVAPKIGQFLKKGISMGLTAQTGLEFLQNGVDQQQEDINQSSQKAPAKQTKNIIEQESPELFSFLNEHVRQGRRPIEAGALAQLDKRFQAVIKKLMKVHKTPWSSIIESIFGPEGTTATSQQPTSSRSLAEEVMNPPGSLPTRPPSAEMNAAGGQQQGQGLDPQVAQILQQGEEILKARRPK